MFGIIICQPCSSGLNICTCTIYLEELHVLEVVFAHTVSSMGFLATLILKIEMYDPLCIWINIMANMSLDKYYGKCILYDGECIGVYPTFSPSMHHQKRYQTHLCVGHATDVVGVAQNLNLHCCLDHTTREGKGEGEREMGTHFRNQHLWGVSANSISLLHAWVL